MIERRGSVVVSTPAWHSGFDPRTRRVILGVKTWLFTLEIVNLCVFPIRHWAYSTGQVPLYTFLLIGRV